MTNEELPRATLSQLLERAVPYERWRAPLDPRLQRLTALSGIALLFHLIFLMVFLPGLLAWSHSNFFLAFGGLLGGLLSWMAAHAFLLALLNLVALSIFLALVWRTQRLKAGNLRWQRTAFAEIATGALGTFPLVVSLAIILFNFILWCLIIGCILALIIGALSRR